MSELAPIVHWDAITPASFPGRVASALAQHSMELEKTKALRTLLVKLFDYDGNWVNDAVLSVLAGKHGLDAQQHGYHAVEQGLNPGGGTASSFLARCFATQSSSRARVALFESVARLPVPEWFKPALEQRVIRFVGRAPMMSTTREGAWLDTLCNTTDSMNSVAPPSHIAFELNTYSTSPAVTKLARLLLDLDPNHKGIEDIIGTAGQAHLNEAMMEARLRQNLSSTSPCSTSSTSPDAGASSTAAERRRSRNV